MDGQERDCCSVAPKPTVFLGNVPIEIFLAEGGELPEGFTTEIAEQFTEIHQYHQFSPDQLLWLADHPWNIPLIHDATFIPAGEEGLYVKPILNFVMENNLSHAQFAIMLQHLGTYFQVSDYSTNYPTDPEPSSSIRLFLDLLINDSEYFQRNQVTNFSTIGSQEWAETLVYEQGTDPTESEIELAITYPAAAIKVYMNVDVAFQKTYEFWGNSGLSMLNHKPDAFRHAYWLALNTQDIGPLAYIFGCAHESEVPLELALERQMDLYNNDVGIAIGYLHYFSSEHHTAEIVHAAVLNGEMKYLSPLDIVASPNYPIGLNGIISTTQLIPTSQ